MAKNKFKLIIWDFDGVIADTEKLWLINRQKLLNAEFGLDWDFATTNHYLGGMSDKNQKTCSG
jgi:beta-phosphoglucomutase-like phosphatase (HAD superfamily)